VADGPEERPGVQPDDLTTMLAAQALTPGDGKRGAGDPAQTGQSAREKHPPGPEAGNSLPASQPNHGSASSSAHEAPALSRRGIVIGAIVLVAALLVFLLVGILPARARTHQLAQRSHDAALADSIPLVGVQRVSRAAAGSDLMLPGTLQSNHETPLYARASGYISHWYTDLGQRVHRGELLATIDAPDLDQQLSQARQQAANANATLQLNRVNLDRWKILYHDSTVTKQELDTFQSNYDASVASVAAADDNVHRLESLVSYERITAPFDGVITERNVEDGVFITSAGTTTTPQAAGAGGNTLIGNSPATELFRVARTDTVRVYLGIPQAYGPAIHVGLPAALEVQELPGRTFVGRVARTANSVDASSRTLLTEVDVVNADGSLLPGMYAEIHFRFQRAAPPMLIPATAMIFRTGSAQAAIVSADSVVHFHNLRIGRDYGSSLEVDSGLADSASVVTQPSDDLRDGEHVHVRPESESEAPGGQSPGGRPENPVIGTQTDSPATRQVPPTRSAPAKASGTATPGQRPSPQFREGFPGSPNNEAPASAPSPASAPAAHPPGSA
jgi:multidrug efflux pump subunit AcrA (membrane-fusion protein)